MTIDVVGPVLAEVFVLCADADGLLLSGPCGAAPWHIEVGDGADPTAVVAETCRRVLGDPLVVHSTSWRTDKGGVMLTFVAVFADAQLRELDRIRIARAELARGAAEAAPTAIGSGQVLEHALRHLAWLRTDDDVVRGALDAAWHRGLAVYQPEPFAAL